MISKSLVLIPAVIAVIALGAPRADAYIGFRLNLAVPLYYPTSGSPTTAVYQAPPAPVAEQVTTAPGPGYVWLAGHRSFYAQSWAWMAGHGGIPLSPGGWGSGGLGARGTRAGPGWTGLG